MVLSFHELDKLTLIAACSVGPGGKYRFCFRKENEHKHYFFHVQRRLVLQYVHFAILEVAKERSLFFVLFRSCSRSAQVETSKQVYLVFFIVLPLFVGDTTLLKAIKFA